MTAWHSVRIGYSITAQSLAKIFGFADVKDHIIGIAHEIDPRTLWQLAEKVATKPLDDALSRTILPDQRGVGDTKKVLSSFRVDPQRRLVFGGVGSISGAGGATQVAWARRAIHRIFPQLKEVEFEYQWGGSIGLTADNLPRFHAPGRNVVSISGYNGRGIAAGTVFGRLLARRILGQINDNDVPLPLTAARSFPFRSVRESFYDFGSRLVHFAIDRY